MIVVKKNAPEPRERLLVMETEYDQGRGFMFLLLGADSRFTEEEATMCEWVSGADSLAAPSGRSHVVAPTPIAMPRPDDGMPR